MKKFESEEIQKVKKSHSPRSSLAESQSLTTPRDQASSAQEQENYRSYLNDNLYVLDSPKDAVPAEGRPKEGGARGNPKDCARKQVIESQHS